MISTYRIVNPVFVGGITGTISSASGQYIGGHNVDIEDALFDGFIGAASGALGAGLKVIGFTEIRSLLFGAYLDTFFIGPIKAQASMAQGFECGKNYRTM